MRNPERVRGGDELARVPERDVWSEGECVDEEENDGAGGRGVESLHAPIPTAAGSLRSSGPMIFSRTCAAERLRHSFACAASEMAPVSSDTTTTIASVSSARP